MCLHVAYYFVASMLPSPRSISSKLIVLSRAYIDLYWPLSSIPPSVIKNLHLVSSMVFSLDAHNYCSPMSTVSCLQSNDCSLMSAVSCSCLLCAHDDVRTSSSSHLLEMPSCSQHVYSIFSAAFICSLCAAHMLLIMFASNHRRNCPRVCTVSAGYCSQRRREAPTPPCRRMTTTWTTLKAKTRHYCY